MSTRRRFAAMRLGMLLLLLPLAAVTQAELLSARPTPEVLPNSPLFAAKSWRPTVVEPLKPVQRQTPKAEPPPPPPPPPEAPPLPFSFAGRLFDGHQLQLFLLYNGQTLTVKAGDQLLQQYKVEQVTATQAVFVYLPYNIRQTLAFNSNNIGSSHWATPTVTTQSRP